MLEKLKKGVHRAKNLGFYLAVTSFLVAGVLAVDAVYEIMNYDYKHKIPAITLALILIAAL